MFNSLYKYYAYLFGKPIFRKFNTFLYLLSLRGLGILNFENDYLQGESYWLSDYLKNRKNPVVFDVGANVGNYSKSVQIANKDTHIFAFEPHPKTYNKLMNNIANPNFNAFNFGIGEEASTIKLYDYEDKDGSGHASLYKNVITDLHKGNPTSHNVEIIKIDDFVKENKINNIDLLKIDTEGHEFNVLMGASETIRAKIIKVIHFEFNEMNIISKRSFKDFWDLLADYKFYRILPGGKLLPIKNYYPLTCEIFAFQNIVSIIK